VLACLGDCPLSQRLVAGTYVLTAPTRVRSLVEQLAPLTNAPGAGVEEWLQTIEVGRPQAGTHYCHRVCRHYTYIDSFDRVEILVSSKASLSPQSCVTNSSAWNGNSTRIRDLQKDVLFILSSFRHVSALTIHLGAVGVPEAPHLCAKVTGRVCFFFSRPLSCRWQRGR
jgi:hypothetical protein